MWKTLQYFFEGPIIRCFALFQVAAFLGNQKEHSDRVDKSANGTFLTHMEEFCINKQLQENGCVSTVRYQAPNCVCILVKISLFFIFIVFSANFQER